MIDHKSTGPCPVVPVVSSLDMPKSVRGARADSFDPDTEHFSSKEHQFVIPEIRNNKLKRAGQATVDNQQVPCHVATIVGSQKDDGPRDIFGIACASHRYMSLLDVPLLEVFRRAFLHTIDYRHGCTHKARSYSIHSNIMSSQFHCQRLGKGDYSSFGRVVSAALAACSEPLDGSDVDDPAK